VADDFGWIYYSRIRTGADAWRLFVDGAPGFYRPLIALSFGANEWFAGIAPLPYALTNLGLTVAIIGATTWLVRTLGLSTMAGVFGAGLWALNFHGISMALLWISGRTSLLATAFAVLAAIAFATRRTILAGVGTLAALLSKEEPLLLPVVFAVWAWLDARADGRGRANALRVAAVAAWPSFAALAVYAAMRTRTNAFTQATAPAFYKLTPTPDVLLPNALQYLDRSLTFTAGVLLLGALVFVRRRPRLDQREIATLQKGIVWLVLGFAVTIMVPVRSSLYVVFPTIGAALIGAAAGAALWRGIPQARRRAAAAAACALPIALAPIHWTRHRTSREQAILSSRIVAAIQAADRERRASRIVIDEDQTRDLTIESVFGGSLPQAMELITGRPISVELVRIDSERPAPAMDRSTLQFTLRNGKFEPASQ
jgi:hypothetical protein